MKYRFMFVHQNYISLLKEMAKCVALFPSFCILLYIIWTLDMALFFTEDIKSNSQ